VDRLLQAFNPDRRLFWVNLGEVKEVNRSAMVRGVQKGLVSARPCVRWTKCNKPFVIWFQTPGLQEALEATAVSL